MSPPNILIVSAESESRDLYAHTLAGIGEVAVACGGAEALHLLRSAPADLIITAETLPDMTGSDLCHSIKTDAGQASPQTILLCSEGDRRCEGADTCFDIRAEVSHLRVLVQALLRARAAEHQLAKTKERTESFLRVVRGGSFEVDREWRVVASSGNATDAFRKTVGDVENPVLWDAAPEIRGTEYESEYRRVMNDRIPIRFDGPSLIHAERWFEVNVIPTALGIAVYYRDISDRKLSELQYKESFELEGIGKAHAASPDGRLLRVNRRMTEITGYSEEELLGMSFHQLTHPEDLDADRAKWERLVSGDVASYSTQRRMVRKDGGVIWAEVHAGVVRDARGLPEGATAVIQDVTERHRLMEQYEIGQQRMRRLFDANVIGLAVANGERVIDCNEALLEMLGQTRDDFRRGIDWRALTPPEYADGDEQRIQELIETGACSPYEKEFQRPDGTRIPVLVGGTLLTNEPEWMSFVIDLTDRKRAQAERERAIDALRRSNEELQQFAYGVSHDLQEPLRTITAFSQLLARKVEGSLDDDSRQYLAHIRTASDRMQSMLRDLLSYSSAVHQTKAKDIVDLAGSVQWALANLAQTIRETSAQVTWDALPSVRGDFSKLTQLFQNLIGNALKYRSPEPPRIHISCSKAHREWALVVADNGTGFDPNYAETIFGVFRRLHGRDVPGSGVGLAICRRIVEQHGGRIWAESQPGAGSSFNFTLPIAD